MLSYNDIDHDCYYNDYQYDYALDHAINEHIDLTILRRELDIEASIKSINREANINTESLFYKDSQLKYNEDNFIILEKINQHMMNKFIHKENETETNINEIDIINDCLDNKDTITFHDNGHYIIINKLISEYIYIKLEDLSKLPDKFIYFLIKNDCYYWIIKYFTYELIDLIMFNKEVAINQGVARIKIIIKNEDIEFRAPILNIHGGHYAGNYDNDYNYDYALIGLPIIENTTEQDYFDSLDLELNNDIDGINFKNKNNKNKKYEFNGKKLLKIRLDKKKDEVKNKQDLFNKIKVKCKNNKGDILFRDHYWVFETETSIYVYVPALDVSIETMKNLLYLSPYITLDNTIKNIFSNKIAVSAYIDFIK
mgnify:CR=1 FL=1|uniref:Uncharacterized protein n=1 Tax=viral metagenome TaxID=1070528 RepID=A0A6C0ACN0_9ZZZZ